MKVASDKKSTVSESSKLVNAPAKGGKASNPAASRTLVNSGPALTPAEQHHLNDCETKIKQCLDAPLLLGAQLSIIKAKQLYRTAFKSYTEYCQHKWQITRVHANRLISADDCLQNLKSEPPGSVLLPTSESHLRPIANLSKADQIKVAHLMQENIGTRQATATEWQQAKLNLFPAPAEASAAKKQNKLTLVMHPQWSFVLLRDTLQSALELFQQDASKAAVEKELQEALAMAEYYVLQECPPEEEQ